MEDAKHVHQVRHLMATGARQSSVEVTQFSMGVYVKAAQAIPEPKTEYAANLDVQPETLLNIMEVAESAEVVLNQTSTNENAVANCLIVEQSRDMTIKIKDVLTAQIGQKGKITSNHVALISATILVENTLDVMVLAKNVTHGQDPQIIERTARVSDVRMVSS